MGALRETIEELKAGNDNLRRQICELTEKNGVLSIWLVDEGNQVKALELQLRAMVEERDLYSDVVDAAEAWLKHHGEGSLAEAEANKALRYQVEKLGQKVADKPKCPHGGVFRGEKCGTCGEEVR